ncbi:MAG: hydrogenase maturation nickel metallochaperone HypA/HybF [Candidatus Bathyarchaeota archaeon]
MHELSLALSIFNLVMDIAEKNNASAVVEVKLKVGELTLINIDHLKFALTTLCKGSKAENMKITIQEVKATCKCKKCWYEYSPTKVTESPGLMHLSSLTCVQCDNTLVVTLTCPKCGGDAELITGKECICDEIKLKVKQ